MIDAGVHASTPKLNVEEVEEIKTVKVNTVHFIFNGCRGVNAVRETYLPDLDMSIVECRPVRTPCYMQVCHVLDLATEHDAVHQ